MRSRILEEPKDAGYPIVYWAFLRDPDGHALELSYGQEIGFTNNVPQVIPVKHEMGGEGEWESGRVGEGESEKISTSSFFLHFYKSSN